MLNQNGKALSDVINEAKDKLKEFFNTRLQMLVSEVKQKLPVWRVALPGIIAAAILGFVGFVLLSFALVAAIAIALGWGWSLLVVGAFYCVVAGGIAFLTYREIKAEGVAPRRTLQVLKQDKLWFENEVRT